MMHRRHVTLRDIHRTRTVASIVHRLQVQRGGEYRFHPETWERIAKELGITIYRHRGTVNNSRAFLRYRERTDDWFITYDETRPDPLICHYLVHEIAHWFQHMAEPEWLCDEREVYYYEGPTHEEQHKLARRVENRILGRMN